MSEQQCGDEAPFYEMKSFDDLVKLANASADEENDDLYNLYKIHCSVC